MLKLLLANFLLSLVCMEAGCFNIDTKYPTVFNGPPRSYFGYTVVFDKNHRVYVGAPRANNTKNLNRFEPGSLFSCSTDGMLCSEMKIKTSVNTDFDLKYRMWFGGTLEAADTGNILACAHRYYNLRYETSCGLCVLIDPLTEKSLDTIMPLNQRNLLYIIDRRSGEYRSYYANGQLGMSAAFMGHDILIGAPGFYEGTGTHILYREILKSDDVNPPSGVEPHSYYGYSLAVGKLYRHDRLYKVVGAPRDENFGKVYIIENFKESRSLLYEKTLKGFELGEYFGSSVLAVDLNGDSCSDLLVGAPLYSVDAGCDEGKVYVYLSDGNEVKFFTELVGDKKPDARFGSALSNIGDLNQDGFQDIAVGAPYEDGTGAVYIYLGSETGIRQEYSQKIEASKINKDLSGFGIHISRGIDVDENSYPDIAVGSYLSSNVVLLKSLPVVDVFLNFFFNPPDMRMNKADCLYEGKNLPCVHIDVCMNYTGKKVPVSLDFLCSVVEEDPDHRGFFFPYRYKNAEVQRNLTAKSNTETCFTLQFYLHSDIKDVVTPVPISLTCELAPLDFSTQNDTSYFSYPVVSPSSVLNVTKSLPFHSGCVSDEECLSDLVVTAELEDMANGSVITLGDVASVTLGVTVRNDGEPAFWSHLWILLPPEVPVISLDICEGASKESDRIKCALGNPLAKDKMVSFKIKLDLTKISLHTREVRIILEGETNSTEVKPEDNVATVTLGVQAVSDIGIRGVSSHSLILYHETEGRSSTIKHKYTVRNHGPSPLHSIDIILQVPNAVIGSHGRTEFLFFTGLQTDSQSGMTIPSACNSSHLDTEWFLSAVTMPTEEDYNATFSYENNSFVNFINKRYLSGNRAEGFDFQSRSSRGKRSLKDERENHVLSCDSKDVECVTVQCSASPFADLKKFAEVSVTFEIDFRSLQSNFKSWSQIELISTASLFTADKDVLIFPDHPKISRVKTVFLDVRLSKATPKWLYFASFIVGCTLLLQVVFVLIKVGFFKRKEKMALNRLKQSFFEANLEEELLIDPSENDDLTDEDSGKEKE